MHVARRYLSGYYMDESAARLEREPWGRRQQEEKEAEADLFFEDNFDPNVDKPEFRPLDDTKQYLEVLERRLARIKNDPHLVAHLTAKRDDCMRILLGPNGDQVETSGSQIDLDQVVRAEVGGRLNELMRRVQPEQPLNLGEVVPIVRHDQLQRKTEEEELREESVSR